MNGVSVREMLVNGWPVLSVLALLSAVSLSVVLERGIVFSRARMDALGFMRRVLEILERGGPELALDFCRESSTPVAAVAAEVLRQAGGREACERALRHAVQAQAHELGRWLPLLGTIAGVAPFVGLLGTVIGIIKAFKDMAGSGGGGPEVVMAGIAEALGTTACGLFVAIPAVMMFNLFVRLAQSMAEEIDLAAYELIEQLAGNGQAGS